MERGDDDDDAKKEEERLMRAISRAGKYQQKSDKKATWKLDAERREKEKEEMKARGQRDIEEQHRRDEQERAMQQRRQQDLDSLWKATEATLLTASGGESLWATAPSNEHSSYAPDQSAQRPSNAITYYSSVSRSQPYSVGAAHESGNNSGSRPASVAPSTAAPVRTTSASARSTAAPARTTAAQASTGSGRGAHDGGDEQLQQANAELDALLARTSLHDSSPQRLSTSTGAYPSDGGARRSLSSSANDSSPSRLSSSSGGASKPPVSSTSAYPTSSSSHRALNTGEVAPVVSIRLPLVVSPTHSTQHSPISPAPLDSSGSDDFEVSVAAATQACRDLLAILTPSAHDVASTHVGEFVSAIQRIQQHVTRLASIFLDDHSSALVDAALRFMKIALNYIDSTKKGTECRREEQQVRDALASILRVISDGQRGHLDSLRKRQEKTRLRALAKCTRECAGSAEKLMKLIDSPSLSDTFSEELRLLTTSVRSAVNEIGSDTDLLDRARAVLVSAKAYRDAPTDQHRIAFSSALTSLLNTLMESISSL